MVEGSGQIATCPSLPNGLRLTGNPSRELLAEVFKLRVRAWAARTSAFPPGLESWSDTFDAIAHHFVIVDADRPVAAARLTIHSVPAEAPDGELYDKVSPADAPAPLAAISRLVVCQHHASAGLSSLLDDVRLRRARELGCKSVLVANGASDARIVQLEALGFRSLYRACKQVPGVLAQTCPPFIMVLRLDDAPRASGVKA